MRCRTMIEEDGKRNIVWFGSYGKNEDGTAKKAYVLDQSEDAPKPGVQQANSNFSSDLQAIADDLTQKLSVMRGELWHSMNFGLPLLDKVKNKTLIDTAVADLVLKQKEVNSILSFGSYVSNHIYSCKLTIQTTLGDIIISV